MNIKSNLKFIWLAFGVFSVILTVLAWFGFDSDTLRYAILVLNGLLFLLSVPISLFYVPVAVAASYYLDIYAFSTGGIYLNTFFLFALGFVQWFWIARFWSPSGSTFQSLDLLDEKSN